MNKIFLLTIIWLTVFSTGSKCFAQKTDKKDYNFPEEMSEDIRSMYRPMADKGLALYQLTCAQCHSKTVKGKDVIPDFTMEQLELYQIRIANETHEVELKENQLSQQELSLITTFFKYKQPTGLKAEKGQRKKS